MSSSTCRQERSDWAVCSSLLASTLAKKTSLHRATPGHAAGRERSQVLGDSPSGVAGNAKLLFTQLLPPERARAWWPSLARLHCQQPYSFCGKKIGITGCWEVVSPQRSVHLRC